MKSPNFFATFVFFIIVALGGVFPAIVSTVSNVAGTGVGIVFFIVALIVSRWRTGGTARCCSGSAVFTG